MTTAKLAKNRLEKTLKDLIHKRVQFFFTKRVHKFLMLTHLILQDCFVRRRKKGKTVWFNLTEDWFDLQTKTTSKKVYKQRS